MGGIDITVYGTRSRWDDFRTALAAKDDEIAALKAAAQAYWEESTFLPGYDGECQSCDESFGHKDDCKFAIAEKALLKLIGEESTT